jgi:hypothetical protein
MRKKGWVMEREGKEVVEGEKDGMEAKEEKKEKKGSYR